MNTQEWALILFTILAQMAVGSFLVLGVLHAYARRQAGEAAAERLSDRALLALGPVMVLALIASLFHLGSPLNAPRAVLNLGSSWLSREIFMGVLFTVSGGLFALMQWRKIASSSLRNITAWIAAIVGLGFIFSMSQWIFWLWVGRLAPRRMIKKIRPNVLPTKKVLALLQHERGMHIVS
jgi:anaerobic dimethyl sulfoxide reductase subunit C (anchor subunit)